MEAHNDQQKIVEFVNTLQVPQEFSQRFIHNFTNRNQWWQSNYAHDTWFNKYYPRYDKFIQGIKRELIENIDYQLASPAGGVVQTSKRHIYLISFNALQQLEMKCDRQTRIYHVKLQEEVQNFIVRLQQKQLEDVQTQLQQQQMIIDEQQQQIDHYESLKKQGLIYEIYYINDENENYIGMHEGIDETQRFKTHIQSALSQLKQPLYRRIFREGLQYFKIRKIKDVQYYHTNELEDIEQQMIKELDPSLNRNYVFVCNCDKVLHQEYAILQHRLDCEQYQRKLS